MILATLEQNALLHTEFFGRKSRNRGIILSYFRKHLESENFEGSTTQTKVLVFRHRLEQVEFPKSKAKLLSNYQDIYTYKKCLFKSIVIILIFCFPMIQTH